jgi:hypothetical protein
VYVVHVGDFEARIVERLHCCLQVERIVRRIKVVARARLLAEVEKQGNCPLFLYPLFLWLLSTSPLREKQKKTLITLPQGATQHHSARFPNVEKSIFWFALVSAQTL